MVGEKAVRLHASGRVQGVFFRANTKSKALELGLNGWVRNLPDGRVQAHVEGDKEDVEGLLDYLGGSPGASVVEGLDVEELDAPTGVEGFSIRR